MRLLKTFSKYAFGSLLSLIVGFLTTSILTRLIPTEEMGKYSMFITVGSLIASLIYLGLDQSYVRFYFEEEESSRVYLLIRCMALPLIFSGMLSVVLLCFSNQFSYYVVGESSIYLTVLFCAYVFGLVIDRFFLLKIRMAQKAMSYSLLNVARKVTYLIIAILLYYLVFHSRYWTLVISVTIAEYLIIFGAFIVERKEWCIESRSLTTTDTQILTYGFPFIFSTTITLLFHSIDKIMLKSLTDYNQIGLYSGAQNIVNLLTQVQNVFSTFWVPVAFEHYTKDPEDKGFYIKANKIVSYAMLSIFIIILCSKDIIIHFLGPKYRDAAYIFPFLAFMPVMYTVSETTVLGINFKKKSSYHVWISLICAIANTIGNYFLIQKFGATGAAISTGFTYILFFILRTYFANKVYRVQYSIARFYVGVALVAILALIASFAPVSWWYLCVALCIFVVVSWLYRDTVGEMISVFKAIVYKALQKRQ